MIHKNTIDDNYQTIYFLYVTRATSQSFHHKV